VDKNKFSCIYLRHKKSHKTKQSL